jgi:hypothetical protein
MVFVVDAQVGDDLHGHRVGDLHRAADVVGGDVAAFPADLVDHGRDPVGHLGRELERRGWNRRGSNGDRFGCHGRRSRTWSGRLRCWPIGDGRRCRGDGCRWRGGVVGGGGASHEQLDDDEEAERGHGGEQRGRLARPFGCRTRRPGPRSGRRPCGGAGAVVFAVDLEPGDDRHALDDHGVGPGEPPGLAVVDGPVVGVAESGRRADASQQRGHQDPDHVHQVPPDLVRTVQGGHCGALLSFQSPERQYSARPR